MKPIIDELESSEDCAISEYAEFGPDVWRKLREIAKNPPPYGAITWVCGADSAGDQKFRIQGSGTMSTEIKVGIGMSFNYLGNECVVIGGGRNVKETLSDDEMKTILYGVAFYQEISALNVLNENDVIVYEYANKNGNIFEKKMTGAFMKAMIEQGKMVIKG